MINLRITTNVAGGEKNNKIKIIIQRTTQMNIMLLQSSLYYLILLVFAVVPCYSIEYKPASLISRNTRRLHQQQYPLIFDSLFNSKHSSSDNKNGGNINLKNDINNNNDKNSAVFHSNGVFSSLPLLSGSVTNCGEANDVFQIKDVKFTPDPPRRGQPLTVKIEGELSEDVVDGAYADVSVKLGVVPHI